MLVVDGGASLRCALLGDNIAEMAYKNGWSVSGQSSITTDKPALCCCPAVHAVGFISIQLQHRTTGCLRKPGK